jgi:hypothetical protein
MIIPLLPIMQLIICELKMTVTQKALIKFLSINPQAGPIKGLVLGPAKVPN